MRHHTLRATLAATLIVGMLGLPQAMADTTDTDPTTAVKKDPYTVVQVTDHEDGSGFGTADAPYVTREHGYTVGDEGPKDGVVTSGDTAWYKAHVTFLAAKHRTVTIGFSGLGDALTADTPSCPTGQFITGRASGGECVYDIPTGISESVDLTLNLTANDTGGETVTADPKITVERSDGGSSGLKLGRLTVTSVPLMDVYLDKDDSQSGETEASFNINTVALHPKGVSNLKGFSRLVPYTATLDLTGLPDGVSVQTGRSTLTPTAGLLRLPETTGNRSITITGLPQPAAGEQRQYTLHITVASSAKGWTGQPGDGLGRDESTLDTATGARRGVSYANNDWLMISTTGRNNVPVGQPTGDELYFIRPYNPNQTKWDDGNLSLQSDGQTWTDQFNYGNPAYTYGLNTEFTAEALLDFGGARKGACTGKPHCVTVYHWGDGLTMTSLPTATTEDGTPLPDGTYTVYYGTTVWPKELIVQGVKEVNSWMTTTPPKDLSTVHCIAIIRDESQPDGKLMWGMKATGLGTATVGGGGVNSSTDVEGLALGGTVQVANPRPGSATITEHHSIDRTGRMSGDTDTTTIEPGDTIKGYWRPVLNSLPTATKPVTTSLDICLPDGLTGTSVTADGWTLTPTKTDGCAASWHATTTTTLTVTGYRNGETADTAGTNLPAITWQATVRPTATGTLNASITGTTHMDAWHSLPADTQTVTDTVSLPVTIPDTSAGTVDTGMVNDEPMPRDPGVDDTATWTVTTAAGDTATAMLALPDPSDCTNLMKNGAGPDGDWHEYDRGCTTVKETLNGEPTVDTAMTRGTVTLDYTTDAITGLDPSAYTWQAWDKIDDKTKITGVRATLTGDSQSAVLTRVHLTFAGMSGEGRADVWPGAPYRAGKALTGTSWPGVLLHKYATLTARLFQDMDEDGEFTTTDRTDATGRATIAAIHKSDGAGADLGDTGKSIYLSNRYQATGSAQLTSGWYLVTVAIDGSKPNSYENRIIGSTDTYYGKPDNTHATTPTTRLVHLDAAGTATVDFGWMADTPRLSVTQSETLDGCEDTTCTAHVTVTLKNEGGTTIPEDTLIHTTLSQGTAKDEWSYSTLVMDGEHTVNGGLLRDTAGHYWQYDSTNSRLVRYTNFDAFDTVEATMNPITCGAWAVTTDGRVVSGWQELPGSTAENGRSVFAPPTGHKFIHVRVVYTSHFPSAIAQTEDGALWEYGYKLNDNKFTKLDTGDAVFDLTQQPKVLAGLILVDNQHRFWGLDKKTGALKQGYVDLSADGDGTQPLPDGGPTGVKDIATLPGTTVSAYPVAGKYTYDAPVAAVVDSDGRLWLCHKTGSSDDSLTVKWDRTNVTGVAQLAGLDDGYYRFANGGWNTDITAHTIWYLGEDGGLYRYDPDTMKDGRDMYSGQMDTSLLESKLATPTPGTPVRVLPRETFTRLSFNFYQNDSRTFTAITKDGRLYTWGKRTTIADRTPDDTSNDAPRQTMTATPDTTSGGTTTYRLPFQLAAGDTITLTRTLTLTRGDKDTLATMQTWADGDLTPYSGVKAQRDAHRTSPDPVSTTGTPGTNGLIYGNDSCAINGHEFTDGTSYYREDQCEQTGVTVKALDAGKTVTTGSISGLAWQDTDKNGIRDTSEPLTPGVTVRLADKTGTTVQTTTTASDGTYTFTGLLPGDYTVWMTAGDPKLTWTTLHAGDDRTVDSDIDPTIDQYGSATVTLTGATPDVAHIDGGLTARETTGTLPWSGRMGLLALIGGLLALMLLGIMWMRRKATPRARHRA